TNLDDEELPLVGQTFPISLALLGLGFITAGLLVAGLPPFSGFIGKVSLLHAVLDIEPMDRMSDMATLSAAFWIIGMLLLSGLVTMVSLARVGIRHYWSTGGRLTTQVKIVEGASVLALLLACTLLTVFAEPVLRYTNATAADLHSPQPYIDTVLSVPARPGPTTRTGQEEAP